MSAEAMGYVFRHSPHTGAAFQVHLAIADSVNDQHANEMWMATGTIAKKARVARYTATTALAEIVAAGGLEVVEDHRKDRAGKPSRYRFLFPGTAIYYETRGATRDGTPPAGGATRDGTGVPTTAARGATRDGTNPREPKSTTTAPDGAEPLDGMALDDPKHTLDGMPLSVDPGHTWTETLAHWITGEGHSLPPRDRRDESYAAVVRYVDAHVAKSYPQRTGLFVGILADYVADVAEVDLANGARGQLGRLVKTCGPQKSLWGLTQAVVWGAGLDNGHESDLRALVKYATAAINGQG